MYCNFIFFVKSLGNKRCGNFLTLSSTKSNKTISVNMLVKINHAVNLYN